MAKGGQQKLGVDVCISATGIAGPDGGSAEKPVGMVWVAIATPTKTISQSFNLANIGKEHTYDYP